MTVESQKRRQIVNGTGGLGPYPFTDIPLYEAEQDMAVYIELSNGDLEGPFMVNVDYTIVYNNETLAGSVTFISRSVALDEKVVMVRETALTQGIKLSKSGTIDTTNYEDMVDKTTLQNIDQQDELDRSLRVSTAQIGEFDAEIRAVTSADAGRAVVVNDDGTGFDISITNVNDIDDAVEDAQQAATEATASAASAASSASSAATSAGEAAASAVEAAASAASINFPVSSTPGSYFVRNATDDGYDERTIAQVRSDIGLSKDYNDSIILRQSNTEVTWQGEVRSDDDTTDIVSGSPLTATVTSPAAYAKWYLFVGLDNSDVVHAEFASDTSGTGLVNITGAKRLLLGGYPILSDASGDIPEEFSYNNGYYTIELWSGLLGAGSAILNDDYVNYDATHITVGTSVNSLITADRFTQQDIIDGVSAGRIRINFSSATSDGYVDFTINPTNQVNIIGIGGSARLVRISGIIYNAK